MDKSEPATSNAQGTVAEEYSALPDLVPARMINEYAYCPRLAYMEWVQGDFAESADTLEGRFQHRRTDVEAGVISSDGAVSGKGHAQDGGAAGGEESGRQASARSVLLSGPQVGIIARLDLVEAADGKVTPVDYKHGRMPENEARMWEPDRVQLCAQGLVLRENGYRCDEGEVYYIQSKTRVSVPFSEDLCQKTLSIVGEMRQAFASGAIPPPLEDSPKCLRCSLAGICLPDEVRLLAQADGAIAKRESDIRRLVPARDDRLPVYVQDQGAMVGKNGDLLQIKQGRQVMEEVRLLDVAQVNVFGNVQITTQALRELVTWEIPVCYFTFGGWFVAMTQGLGHKNVELRLAQYSAAHDPVRSARIAGAMVSGKIRNTRTMLRRNHAEVPPSTLRELARLAREAERVQETESLLGFEGAAARAYFAQFSGMLKDKAVSFDFHGRNRRPPRDPVNAVLSFVYALLVKDLTVTLQAVGFDPYLGFLHRPRYGRPALALDLAEEFRPIVGDSVALAMLNGGELRDTDFLSRMGAVALTERGRKHVIGAYERRLDTLITHPMFGYTISYRRVFEVQARLLARHLQGEIPEYRPFMTR
ncbi:MAG: CRISPR-associated endonuclease Cas4g/Cas1g [Bacillota bacterium]